MYRSSPFRSTWNTGYITGLDMCQVYTEAVHSVALGTRVTLQVWTCVKYIPKPVHSVALGTRVTLQVWTCVKYIPKQSIPENVENVPFYTYGFPSASKNMKKKHDISKQNSSQTFRDVHSTVPERYESLQIIHSSQTQVQTSPSPHLHTNHGPWFEDISTIWRTTHARSNSFAIDFCKSIRLQLL